METIHPEFTTRRLASAPAVPGLELQFDSLLAEDPVSPPLAVSEGDVVAEIQDPMAQWWAIDTNALLPPGRASDPVARMPIARQFFRSSVEWEEAVAANQTRSAPSNSKPEHTCSEESQFNHATADSRSCAKHYENVASSAMDGPTTASQVGLSEQLHDCATNGAHIVPIVPISHAQCDKTQFSRSIDIIPLDIHVVPVGDLSQLGQSLMRQPQQPAAVDQAGAQNRSPHLSQSLLDSPFELSSHDSEAYTVQLSTQTRILQQPSSSMRIPDGTTFEKEFDVGFFTGTVSSYNQNTKQYRVVYEDDDSEDMTRGMLNRLIRKTIKQQQPPKPRSSKEQTNANLAPEALTAPAPLSPRAHPLRRSHRTRARSVMPIAVPIKAAVPVSPRPSGVQQPSRIYEPGLPFPVPPPTTPWDTAWSSVPFPGAGMPSERAKCESISGAGFAWGSCGRCHIDRGSLPSFCDSCQEWLCSKCDTVTYRNELFINMCQQCTPLKDDSEDEDDSEHGVVEAAAPKSRAGHQKASRRSFCEPGTAYDAGKPADTQLRRLCDSQARKITVHDVRHAVHDVLSEAVLDDMTTHIVRARVEEELGASIAHYKPQISEEICNFLISHRISEDRQQTRTNVAAAQEQSQEEQPSAGLECRTVHSPTNHSHSNKSQAVKHTNVPGYLRQTSERDGGMFVQPSHHRSQMLPDRSHTHAPENDVPPPQKRQRSTPLGTTRGVAVLREQQADRIAPRCSSTNVIEKKTAELKADKSAAVEAEDYYTARRNKRELDSLITCGDDNNLVQRQSQASAADMDYGRH